MVNENKIKVLSLFDGISCTQVALNRLNIRYEYYASEIEKAAIKVTQHHYPDTIQLGDVTQINGGGTTSNGCAVNITNVDLLIGGSPCQNLSAAGNGQGLKGEQSKLFYEYVRVKEEVKPKYFILENVKSMRNADKDIISSHLGVQPILINSKLFSPQSRERYYWTNITGITSPEYVCTQTLEDVIDQGVLPHRELSPEVKLKEIEDKRYGTPVKLGNIYNSNFKIAGDLYSQKGKSPTVMKANSNCQIWFPEHKKFRRLKASEMELLQTLPLNYTKVAGIPEIKRCEAIGNGFTCDVIAHILSFANF